MRLREQASKSRLRDTFDISPPHLRDRRTETPIPAANRATVRGDAAIDVCDNGNEAIICLGRNSDGPLTLRLLRIEEIEEAGVFLRIKRKPKPTFIVLLASGSADGRTSELIGACVTPFGIHELAGAVGHRSDT